MKNTIRLTLTLLLCLMVCLCLGSEAFAETVASGSWGGNLSWTLDSAGTLTISGSGAMADILSDNDAWRPYYYSIQSVVIEKGVSSICNYAFYCCYNLKDIAIPQGLTSIGNYALSDCHMLMDVVIPQGVTSIGNYAFASCYLLTSVTIPGSAVSVGQSAFYDCPMLTSAGPTGSGCGIEYGWTDAIPSQAFSFCRTLESITIAKGIKSIGTSAFTSCTSLQGFLVEAGNTAFKSKDGILFTKEGSTLVAYPAGKDDTKYTIPNGVTALGSGAFLRSKLEWVKVPEGVTVLPDSCFVNCSNLQTLILPQSLTTLNNECLWRIGMTELTVPASVTSVYGHFAGGGLESIFVDPANPVFTSVDGVMFSKDLKTLVAYPELKTNVYAIPAGTEEIRSHAFAFSLFINCIYIPSSVKTIDTGAFYNTRYLTDVYYDGTLDEWGNVSIGAWNDCLTDAELHCLGGDTLILPSGLKTIQSQAFVGVNAKAVIIPSSVESIADDAFEPGIVIIGKRESNAETYANSRGFEFRLAD